MKKTPQENVSPGFSVADTTKIKGWAIILMFMHHLFMEPERYEGHIVDFTPFSEHFVNTAALSMRICVALFAFISAYGITISYKKICGGNYKALTPAQISSTIYRRGVKLWGSFFFVYLAIQLYSLLVVRDGRFDFVYGSGPKSVIYCIIDALGMAELFHTPLYLRTFWYISLAWIIIFVMPLLLKIYSSLGSAVLLSAGVFISVAFSFSGGTELASFPMYAFVLSVGIITADKDLIVSTAAYDRFPKIIKLIAYIILFMVLLYSRQLTSSTSALPVFDGLIALLTCVMFYEFFNRWAVIKSVLYQIGKYATYMFLLHNFIRVIWYYDFIYSFRYWWLILIVLLMVTFAVSVILDTVKKLTGYERLINRLADRDVCHEAR